VSIDAASLETGNSDRDADMRKDFLEVERFPTIELKAVEVLMSRPTASGGNWDVVLQAQLTVHGTTRAVKVPVTVNLADERLTVHGQVRLDMRDYNIRVPRLLLVPMKSEVLVGFAVVARPVR
jgi:polyisoprenoid-binding protein YceI